MLRPAQRLAAEGLAACGRVLQPECCSSSGRAAWQACARWSSSAAEGTQGSPLVAELRSGTGSIASQKLRKQGKTPGVLFSMVEGEAEEKQLLALEAKAVAKLLAKLGRSGWACHIFDLQIQRPDGGSEVVRALGRQVHMTADTDAIENVTFIDCPPERHVRVDIPLRVIGDEVCPGLKAGGSINWIKRSIPCMARGDAIPPFFEVDISKLELNGKLFFTDLELPEGTMLREKDPSLPIIKVSK